MRKFFPFSRLRTSFMMWSLIYFCAFLPSKISRHPSMPMVTTLSISYSKACKTSSMACLYPARDASYILSSMRSMSLARSSAYTRRAVASISVRCSSARPPCPSVVRLSNDNKFLLIFSSVGGWFWEVGSGANHKPTSPRSKASRIVLFIVMISYYSGK